jgi:AraC-like DNA-binding protein
VRDRIAISNNNKLNSTDQSFGATVEGEFMLLCPALDPRQTPNGSTALYTGAPIPFVRANALAPFVSFLNTIGAPVDRLLRQAQLSHDLLHDPEALMPLILGYRFLEMAARKEQMEDIGVVVGQHSSAFDLGRYGAALQGVPTVYEYLQNGVRLIGDHSSGTRLWLKLEGDALRLNQYLTGPPGPGRCMADLYTLVITINTLRNMIAPTWSPGEVRLLAGDEVLLGDRRVFGDALLITGQRHSSFTIPRSLLQLPVRSQGAKATPATPLMPVSSRPMPADFKTSAEQLIATLLVDGHLGILTTAEAAGMSPRTLQRRLAEAGVSYSGLVAATRLRMAKTWLTKSDLPISEIAATLGYNEASNFARAFRRETGLSPAAYRRSPAHDSAPRRP